MMTLMGLPVVLARPLMRYVLPADVPPPTGMTREQFDSWSRQVCGYTRSIVPDGQVFNVNGTLCMTEETWYAIQRTLETGDAQ